MKRKTRNSVFETNSSSCHSIVYKNSTLDKCTIPISDDGIMRISLQEFEDCGTYDSQYDKLSYIFTHLYYGHESSFEDSYDYKMVVDYIKEYTGCKEIVIENKEDAYINHQLYDCLEEIVNIWRKDSVISFVFNDNIELSIWRD